MNDICQYSKPFIIAEIGLNHNGDADIAKKLIIQAKEAGADAVKFQLYDTKEFIPYNDKAFLHLKERTRTTVFDFFRSCELSRDNIRDLRQISDNIGIAFGFSIFSESLYDFAMELNPDFIKIASSEINFEPLIEFLKASDKTIIASTGMSELHTIDLLVEALNSKSLILLYCNSLYPPEIEDISINNIKILYERYDIPVGFSDHTMDNYTAILALSLGCPIYERHITLSRDMEGPDHCLSLDIEGLRDYILLLNKYWNMLQIDRYFISEREISAKEFVKRRAFLRNDLKKGNKISMEDIVFLRHNEGILFNEFLKSYQNKEITKDLSSGALLSSDHFR